VLKLDIKGFFMHINKTLLFIELQGFIEQKSLNTDKELLLELCHKIIDYDPTQNCIIKSKPE
jgi:RNA-directed DNA polymerase